MNKNFAIIGENVEKSRSVYLNHEFMKIRQAKYTLLSIPKDNFSFAIAEILRKYDGINVTVPYKQAIIPYLDELSGDAKSAGAVNTVVFFNNKTVGYNTDCIAFEKTLKENNIDLTDKKILLCGAGGEAHSIALALKKRNAKFDILNRTKQNTVDMINKLQLDVKNVYENCREIEQNYDIIINATVLGRDNFSDLSPVTEDIIKGAELVIDTNYYPSNRRLSIEARIHGVKIIDGLELLIYQALEAEKLWLNDSNITYDAKQLIEALR